MKATILNEAEKERLQKALEQAEKNTSGEIVPVITQVSGRYDRAEDIAGLLTAVVFLIAGWGFFTQTAPAAGDFAGNANIFGSAFLPALTVIIGFIVGSSLATYFPVIRLPFISKAEMKEEVERRAAESFYRLGIGNTTGATGVLIYISLFERMVAVKGDRAISEKLEQDDWNEVCAEITSGMKEDSLGDGLKNGIDKAGKLLAAHFPRAENDTNELRDEVYIF